ncbi:MAG: shikimate dehydrogenase [Leptospiraceae bacterium]|nr:shikimate dehydrogenase [Leptospiraceae bacterium]MCP5501717.1 shikimate dehydrogenase [Leptospiraceae bacterium]
MKNTQSINSKTKIFGIFGYPLGHTLSPLIHNGLFQEFELDALYLVFESKEPAKILNACSGIGLEGVSVTIPFKEWAYETATERDPASEYMKAANTLIRTETGFKAYNTDGIGALNSILRYVPGFFENTVGDIYLVGSGGSARGIAFALVSHGLQEKKLRIVARNQEKAENLIQDLNQIKKNAASYLPLESLLDTKNTENISLLINTSPLGMKGVEGTLPISNELLDRTHSVFDIVYNPLETALLKQAKGLARVLIPGYEMLIYQAMEQFFLFTEIRPTEELIEKVRNRVLDALNKKL